MKRRLAFLLALICVLSLLVPVPGAAAASRDARLTLSDLASMDADSVFTMDQVLALLQEAYTLGYQEGKKAGASPGTEERSQPALSLDGEPDYVLNTNSHKFHYPDCESVADMNPKNRLDFHGSREEVIAMGYVPCKRCKP